MVFLIHTHTHTEVHADPEIVRTRDPSVSAPITTFALYCVITSVPLVPYMNISLPPTGQWILDSVFNWCTPSWTVYYIDIWGAHTADYFDVIPYVTPCCLADSYKYFWETCSLDTSKRAGCYLSTRQHGVTDPAWWHSKNAFFFIVKNFSLCCSVLSASHAYV